MVLAAILRGAGRKRIQQSLLSSVLNRTNPSRELCRRTKFSALNFSSASKEPITDDILLRVIDFEIKCALECDDHERIEKFPNDFPFKFQDNPERQTVSLEREYYGETIKVEVHMPDLVTGDRLYGTHEDGDTRKKSPSNVPLTVKILKKNGPCLVFPCTAFPDEIVIDGLVVSEPKISEERAANRGANFFELDEKLQKAFHKYLEMRGVTPSSMNCLHEYMINKDSRGNLRWLRKLKSFIAE